MFWRWLNLCCSCRSSQSPVCFGAGTGNDVGLGRDYGCAPANAVAALLVSVTRSLSLSPSCPHSCTSRPESQQPSSCLAPASATPTAAATPAKEQQLRSITMPAELPKRGEHQFPPAVLLFKRSPILSLSASSRWAGGRAIDPPSLASLFRLFLFFTVLPYVVPVLPSLHL